MNLFGLLNAVIQIAPKITESIDTSFITDYIGWLIAITGSVGVGIILFTLTLKLIVLPFDIYSKFKTKKNAVKMEEMRPELEKLQKQYANDKNLYQQKMLALQKKNGYSPLSGCLPMILSMVIFMIAIDSFRMYSADSMKTEYNNLVDVYNEAVVDVVDDYNTVVEISGSDVKMKDEAFYNNVKTVYAEFGSVSDWIDYSAENGNTFKASAVTEKEGKYYLPAEATAVIDAVNDYHKSNNNGEDIPFIKSGMLVFDADAGSYYLNDKADSAAATSVAGEIMRTVGERFKEEKLVSVVNATVKRVYQDENDERNLHSKFLWVKNIWMPDVSYKSPVSDFDTFKQNLISNSTHACSSCGCKKVEREIEGLNADIYNLVTAGLSEEKEEPNGYFIMVALSILMTFLSQFIMQKMNKAQVELQSTEGDQAVMTQKMMMWMMPIMFGFFAFQYSTSFSIYMTLSSLISTVSSVLINVAVEKKFKKPVELSEGRSKKNLNKIEQEKLAAEEEARKKAEEKANKKSRKKENKKDPDKKDFIK